MAYKNQFMRVDDETKRLARQLSIYYQLEAPVKPTFNELAKISFRKNLNELKTLELTKGVIPK